MFWPGKAISHPGRDRLNPAKRLSGQRLNHPVAQSHHSGFGRPFPQFFLADGSIKIRLTDSHGNEKLVADGVLVTGASSGGGGGSAVDATTVLTTGDIKARYGTGILAGFVRANGRTIGSATSGATERANADCQALFEYLWGADITNLSVSGGRGASANADWLATKTITLPDLRGRPIAGLDDMGNSSANRLTASYFGANGTVLGNSGGSESQTLLTGNLPAYTPSGTFTGSIAALSLTVSGTASVNSSGLFLQGGVSDNFSSIAGSGQFDNLSKQTVASTGTITGTATGNYTPAGIISMSAQGGTSIAFAIVPPMMVMTIYVKL
jgi:hypothetical protein